MAKSSGIGQRLYVGGYEISGDVGSIDNASSPNALLDVTGIDKSALARIIGLRTGMLSFTAFFNDATDAEHDALKGLPTADVLALWLMGTTRGDVCAALTAKQINYDGTRAADGSLTFKVDLQGTAGLFLEYGDLLVAKNTHSSPTDETGIDFGSQTTVGAVGFLQHFGAADPIPTGTIEYDIEDSSDSTNGDDGSWANLLAFSDVATPWAEIAQRVAVNGNVERWVRASTNGTFANADFAMGFRRRETGDVDAA